MECLPITDLPFPYVVFKPLSEVTAAEEPPVLVVFYVNVDQLSALAVLANYSRPGIENVLLPFGSGCQSVFLIPYGETKKDNPRAVVGLTDITVRPMVAPDMLSFAVPYAMFRELEDNVPGSFFEKPAWQKVLTRLKRQQAD